MQFFRVAISKVKKNDSIPTYQQSVSAVIFSKFSCRYVIFVLAAWVAFSEELVNSRPDIAVLDTYEREIENVLFQNGIDVSTMVDIDLSFHELNNLVMGDNSRSQLVGISMTDVEKEFIKLICKMIT